MDEPEPLRDGAAADVAGGAGDGEAVEIQRGKGVINEHAAARGDQAAPLMLLGEPIAEGRIPVLPVDAMITGDAGDAAVEENRRLDVAIAPGLLCHVLQEAAGI